MATVTERTSVAVESLSIEAVRSLMQPQVAPCLSLYLPTHRNVPDSRLQPTVVNRLPQAIDCSYGPGPRMWKRWRSP